VTSRSRRVTGGDKLRPYIDGRRAVLLVLSFVFATAAATAQPGAAQPAAGAGEESLDEAAILGPPRGEPIAGAELDARTRALGDRMRCPVCQGLSIAASPSPSAFAMMKQVRDLLERGYTEEQVLDYFVRSYGEFVLLEPTTKGFNLAVWLLPVLAVGVGLALIALRLRKSRGERAASPSSTGATASTDRELDPWIERVRSETSR